MATCEWVGNALAVAQVHTWTFAGTWEATDVINVTINGKTISVVAGSTVAPRLRRRSHGDRGLDDPGVPRNHVDGRRGGGHYRNGGDGRPSVRLYVHDDRNRRRRADADDQRLGLVYRDGSLRGERAERRREYCELSGPLSGRRRYDHHSPRRPLLYGLNGACFPSLRPFSRSSRSFGRTGFAHRFAGDPRNRGERLC